MGVEMGFEQVELGDSELGSLEDRIQLSASPGALLVAPDAAALPQLHVPSPAELLRRLRAGEHWKISWTLSLAFVLAALFAIEAARPVAYDSPTLRACAETVLTLFAFAAALLVERQFAQSRRLRDLCLFAALMILGVTHLGLYVIPVALGLHSGGIFGAAALWQEVFLAGAFVAVAIVPSGTLIADGRRSAAIASVAAASSAGISALLGLALHGALVAPGTTPRGGIDAVGDYPLAIALVVLASTLFVRAAVTLARRERTDRDCVSSLLCAATMLLCAAQLQHLVLPSLGPGWLSMREPMRVLALALLLAAAVRQELRMRDAREDAAAAAERRRVARDLHDGLAQDLALIAAHSDRIASELGPDHPVVIAAKRALSLSRETISQLSDPARSSPREALEAVAHELGGRFGIAVAVDTELDGEISPHAREQLTRIAREAIANAARHGGARNVVINLKRSGGVVSLRVRDDGRGIAGPGRMMAPEGFGLRSMQERAASLGGYMTVRQPGRSGTELEVVLP